MCSVIQKVRCRSKKYIAEQFNRLWNKITEEPRKEGKIMRRNVVIALFLLLSISVAVPAVAYAQDLFATPDMAAPVAMVTFGLVGLVGGVAGYIRRHYHSSK